MLPPSPPPPSSPTDIVAPDQQEQQHERMQPQQPQNPDDVLSLRLAQPPYTPTLTSSSAVLVSPSSARARRTTTSSIQTSNSTESSSPVFHPIPPIPHPTLPSSSSNSLVRPGPACSDDVVTSSAAVASSLAACPPVSQRPKSRERTKTSPNLSSLAKEDDDQKECDPFDAAAVGASSFSNSKNGSKSASRGPSPTSSIHHSKPSASSSAVGAGPSPFITSAMAPGIYFGAPRAMPNSVVAGGGPGSVYTPRTSATSSRERRERRQAIEDWSNELPGGIAFDGEGTIGKRRVRGHLPSWSDWSPGERTSYPIIEVNNDLDASLKKLVSKVMFQKLLEHPVGKDRFPEHLIEEGHHDSLVDYQLWSDSQSYRKLLREVQHVGDTMHDVFLSTDSEIRSSSIPDDMRQASQVVRALQEDVLMGPSPFDEVGARALETLYRAEFAPLLKKKIVDQARIRLGLFPSQQERGDLGDVFCLTDPRLPDGPIVMASDGFLRLTEYPREEICGRNCRFLQGPSSDQVAVNNIRTALQAGRPCCEILLNYKASGEPFWNCLSIIPLKNAESGEVEHFVAGQIDISAALESVHSLSILIGAGYPNDEDDEDDGEKDESSQKDNIIRFSSPVSLKLGSKSMFGPDRRQSVGFVMSETIAEEGITSPDEPRTRENLKDTSPLERQLSGGLEIYSKMLLVNAETFKVQYVTAGLLRRLGYPISTQQEVYASPLLQQNFIDLITLQSTADTTSLRTTVREILTRGVAHSLACGLPFLCTSHMKRPKTQTEDGGLPIRRGLLHLTPLKDKEGKVQLYAVVMGD